MGRSGLVAEPIVKARMRHNLAPSKVSTLIIWAGRMLIPAYLNLALSFRKIEIRHPEKIIETLRGFQEKRSRVIVAFRHPYGDEPQLLFHVFDNLIFRYAKRLGTPLKRIPHIRNVHDYAVPLWGDALIRFVLPRAGAVPVYHVKFDAASLQNIRSILADDPCPLGLAPEGQISYHSETLPRIEQGTVRIGFWCARDLEKAGRPEKMLILPLSVHYQYDVRDERKIRSAVDRLDAICGIDHPSSPGQGCVTKITCADLLPRIDAIESRVLDITESFYEKTYGCKPKASHTTTEDEGVTRQRRWVALQEAALDIAEHALGIDPKDDDTVQRMYRIRLEGWDRVYPESPVDSLSPLESALAHRRTGEAWFAMRHMELVDLMSYQDAEYLSSYPSFDRIVETVINLQDLVARLMGGNIKTRPNVIRKKAVLVSGPCLDLTARLLEYHKDVKQTTRDATDELAKRFKDCIKEYLNGKEC